MKLFFLADVHGSAHYMSRALELFEKEKASYIVLLGDLLYHGPRNPFPKDYDPASVVGMLNNVREKIIAVRGNCDSDVDQMVLPFPLMSDHGSILVGNRRIFLTHGHIYSPENLPPLTKGDIFVSAHTHIPLASIHEGIYLFNPGSVALPKGGSRNSYGIFDNGDLVVKNLDGKVENRVIVPGSWI